ncbi:MAG TPA: aa3-type cytochrome c oxidase subunit IV [Rhodobacterales bacterium]|nr:aa3-type cytochrome c oxidase subunit IV [Rhodobacterales bacterium]
MTEHEHGSMSIRDHEKTFEGFIQFTKRSLVVILFLVVILAIFGA